MIELVIFAIIVMAATLIAIKILKNRREQTRLKYKTRYFSIQRRQRMEDRRNRKTELELELVGEDEKLHN